MGTDSSTGQLEATSIEDDGAPTPVFETQYEYSDASDSLTVIIIDAIADELDISPTEVVPKISEAVDPDALERILRPLPDGQQRNGTLVFTLLDFRIRIESDGIVRMYDARESGGKAE